MNTKDTIQKDAETGHTPQVFGFDGFGINGCDLYASRLATLTEEGHKQKVGHLLAAAPELLDWIKSVVSDRVLTESKLTEGQQLICKVGNKS